jgi:glycosyltransferase involved in cell wall biosynthesis
LVNDFGLAAKGIALINNGIDTDSFTGKPFRPAESIRGELKLKPGEVVGIIARLSDVKGHKFLIEAMKIVLEKHPQAQLVIIGEGKMQDELTVLVSKLGIQKSVIFIPKFYNTREVLSVMDVFVMPSLQEGLGLALMEAMACGLAVVGSNVGGIKTLIENGSRGLLVESANALDLAEAICRLLVDSRLRVELGAKAQEFIRKNFSQSVMVAETEKEYLECVKIQN